MPVASLEGFRHEAYVYDSPAQFARDMTSFVLDGLRSDENVAVAETQDKIEVLREHLGEDAGAVEFFDMVEIGRNPARIIAVWEDFVRRSQAAGRGMRGIGEPAWPGRRLLELGECRLHELLLNTAFDGGAPWWLVCPYDATRLPEESVVEALRTHPSRLESGLSHTNPGYDAATVHEAFAEPLPAPPEHAVVHHFDETTVVGVRTVVADHAAAHDLPPSTRDALVLAAWEVAVNSVRHGGGAGWVRLWQEPEVLVCQFEDAGRITDPLVGRRPPSLNGHGGRGVYLANHLCDLVQLRSSADGTTVRLHAWL
ncbi:sensor histidine kinase [Nocardioides coralli]|uniref:sensor histidine kinase n=1 Tax=Nocardioides coralli TaxID=2872154 RepID=UPI001CA3AE6D|nr:sensor histidine kinase [Nocardioides coralli]QZY27727.1 sensor histidine kinase [Nocardioides coralli]